ncbi:hypothetical protein NE237_008946 [Protea cynaroides]|uniref:Uncharacterized protein n=1 Tax=Protea cynaroides TaxID=273540 RepID=A0A9Q0KXF5_9MAGN|nr:hypothetical protein NE237_008946 [Protea cynaroides]
MYDKLLGLFNWNDHFLELSKFWISKYFLKFALLHNNTSLDLSRSTMWLKFCLAVLILSNVAVSLESAVSSKDLGSKWMKAAVVNVKPGQSLISIPINEMSKKKSRVLVAFQGGNRLLGEEAARIIARYPDKAERKGLLQAAKLAVIKVLLLINEHSGTALQYGKTDLVNQFQVKDVRWNTTLGGSAYGIAFGRRLCR